MDVLKVNRTALTTNNLLLILSQFFCKLNHEFFMQCAAPENNLIFFCSSIENFRVSLYTPFGCLREFTNKYEIKGMMMMMNLMGTEADAKQKDKLLSIARRLLCSFFLMLI